MISNDDVIVFVIKRNTCITSPKLRGKIGDVRLYSAHNSIPASSGRRQTDGMGWWL